MSDVGLQKLKFVLNLFPLEHGQTYTELIFYSKSFGIRTKQAFLPLSSKVAIGFVVKLLRTKSIIASLSESVKQLFIICPFLCLDWCPVDVWLAFPPPSVLISLSLLSVHGLFTATASSNCDCGVSSLLASSLFLYSRCCFSASSLSLSKLCSHINVY